MSTQVSQILEGFELNAVNSFNGALMYHADNLEELDIEINFDQDSPDATISTNSWAFTKGAYALIKNRFDLALTGSRTVFEGLELITRVQDGADFVEFKQTLSFYEAVWGDCSVQMTAVDKGKYSWLNENADSFQMEYLLQTGHITTADWVFVPYAIDRKFTSDEILTILSIVFISDKIAEETKNLQANLIALSNILTALPQALIALINLAYLVTLIIALVDLILDIIDLIIQPVKYHAGMYVIDQLKAASRYLGKDFTSPIFDKPPFNQLLILPTKSDLLETEIRALRFIKGWIKPDRNTQKGVYEGTFGDLLRLVKQMFNAKLIITDSEIKLVRVDYTENTGVYQLPMDQEGQTFGTNMSEFIANYSIVFQTDLNDRNTFEEYTGTSYTNQIVPKVVGDIQNVSLQGFENINIPFSIAKRKYRLNVVEQIMKTSLTLISVLFGVLLLPVQLIQGIISIFNPNQQVINTPNFGNLIDDRIGMMRMENDLIVVPRMLLLARGSKDRQNKIPSNYAQFLNAKYIHDNFHSINSFVPSVDNPNGNQWIRKRYAVIPFCFSDYLKVINNNRVIDSEGRKAKFEGIKWNPVTQTSRDVAFRINQAFDLSLTTKTIEQNGR